VLKEHRVLHHKVYKALKDHKVIRVLKVLHLKDKRVKKE
tara:strand:+ start:477 stop:593 length:117 start_codon:yes stop_codon:yes gene_type:complete